jgi:tetratricopeptide (TPR) repeat protein
MLQIQFRKDASTTTDHASLSSSIIDIETCTDNAVCVNAHAVITSRSYEISGTTTYSGGQLTIHDDGSITLGSITYQTPFSKYPSFIQDLLSQFERKTNQRQQDLLSDAQAQWIQHLGILHHQELLEYADEFKRHRQQSMNEDTSPEYNAERVRSMLKHGENALQTAKLYYERQLKQLTLTPPRQHSETLSAERMRELRKLACVNRLGEIHFYLSEMIDVLIINFETSEQVEFNEIEKQHHMRQREENMLQALEFFRECKDANLGEEEDNMDDPSREAPELFSRDEQIQAAFNWGLALFRIASMHITASHKLLQKMDETSLSKDIVSVQQPIPSDELDAGLVYILSHIATDLLKSVTTSQTYLEQAIEFFSKAKTDLMHPADAIMYVFYQAMSLQQLAETKSILGALAESTEVGEKALLVFQQILKAPPDVLNDVSQVDAVTSMADLLVSLSQGYLQQGKYDRAIHYYKEAMAWYEANELEPPSTLPNAFTLRETDGSIDVYEQLLDDYKLMTSDVSDAGIQDEFAEYDEDGNVIFMKNDAFQSQLHASLGALYMLSGDMYQASSHLTQALFFFRKSGEEEDAVLADVLYNTASLKFAGGEFKESASFYEQAVQIFRRVTVDGDNPIARSLDSFALGPLSDLINEGLLTSNAKDETSETLPTKGSSEAPTKGSSEAKDTHAKVPETKNTGKSFHQEQPKLSLDSYRGELINATQNEL